MVIGRLTSFAVPFLRRHPRLMALARRVQFRIWHLRVRIRTRRLSQDLDVNHTYWVDPDKIEYALMYAKGRHYDKYADRGKVIGGDWDVERHRFTEHPLGVFRGLHDRFIRGMPWEQTELYRRILDWMSKGIVMWGCKDKAKLDERCRYLDCLFQDIKSSGYRSQQEIAQEEGSPYKGEDEITVWIDRDGVLLLEDGQHRLAMAKLLGIDRIPIKITVRHSDWYQFRKEVIDHARTHGGMICHPVTHPDLREIPSIYGDERFELIQAHLPIQSGDLLDIGAHWGYFCHKFEEEGFNCYAVESDAASRYFMEKLKIAEGRKFAIIQGSILDYRDKTDFDVILALNIVHHLIKARDTYYELMNLLKRLNMKVMFFETELPDSPQMKGAYRNFDCDEFVDFILENSNLNEAVCIGKTKYGRPIYRLQAV